jgi:hypothetical protein
MNAASHPSESYRSDFDAVQKRATAATIAPVLTALVRVYTIPVRLWQSGLLNADPPERSALARRVVGFFWVGSVIANIAMRANPHTAAELPSANALNNVGGVVDIVSALLAVLVVRAVTARLMERHRRVRHNPVEALDAAGITVG